MNYIPIGLEIMELINKHEETDSLSPAEWADLEIFLERDITEWLETFSVYDELKYGLLITLKRK